MIKCKGGVSYLDINNYLNESPGYVFFYDLSPCE